MNRTSIWLFSFNSVSSVLTGHFLFSGLSFPPSPMLKNHISSFSLDVCIPMLYAAQADIRQSQQSLFCSTRYGTDTSLSGLGTALGQMCVCVWVGGCACVYMSGQKLSIEITFDQDSWQADSRSSSNVRS